MLWEFNAIMEIDNLSDRQSVSDEISKCISSLRYLLVVFVVFIHSTFSTSRIEGFHNEGVDIIFADDLFANLIQRFLTDGICRCAVPLFFFISGYLALKRSHNFVTLLIKKIKSILVPYFVWLLIPIPFFCLKIDISKFSLLDWEKYFLGYGNSLTMPGMVHLWFLRDLFIVSLLLPVICFLIKRIPREFFILLVVLYFHKINFLSFNDRIGTALFYFSLGCYASFYDFDFIDFAKKLNLIIAFVIFTITFTFFYRFEDFFLQKFLEIEASLIILKISSYLVKNIKLFSFLKYLSGFSFFLYAIHYMPFYTILMVKWVKVFPMVNGFWQLFEYFGFSIFIIFVDTLIGITLKKVCPPVFRFLNGGR